MKKYYQIEEVAVKTGLTKRALRYYEDIELIIPSRTEAGYRLYSEDDLENLSRIIEVKESLGFCLTEIKDILELEKVLKALFDGELRDIDTINKSIDRVKKQIQFVEKKELALIRVKTKYNDRLNKLLNIAEEVKGEMKNEEVGI